MASIYDQSSLLHKRLKEEIDTGKLAGIALDVHVVAANGANFITVLFEGVKKGDLHWIRIQYLHPDDKYLHNNWHFEVNGTPCLMAFYKVSDDDAQP